LYRVVAPKKKKKKIYIYIYMYAVLANLSYIF